MMVKSIKACTKKCVYEPLLSPLARPYKGQNSSGELHAKLLLAQLLAPSNILKVLRRNFVGDGAGNFWRNFLTANFRVTFFSFPPFKTKSI